MATFDRPGASISFDEYGKGFPLLLIAPGGMHSVASMWSEREGSPGVRLPWIDPTTDLSDEFHVVSMDQRNAGASTGEVSAEDGWHTYTSDHLALMDHLGLSQVHAMGGCIGSSYVLSLCAAAPDRVAAAVLQNPIGLSEENRHKFIEMFDSWASDLASRRGFDPGALESFKQNMFGGDFVFSVSRDFVRSCPVPLLVLPGDDDFHPRAVAEEIVDLAPDAELLDGWAGNHASTAERIRAFLTVHTPDSNAA
ncbi:MAG TPA: alpha/beta hydrolase [Acidimicrobiales bacterium]|nr:alpha/beta hydrolase [Acidimicrobiales bacterium]